MENKKPSVGGGGEYEYFLELHIVHLPCAGSAMALFLPLASLMPVV